MANMQRILEAQSPTTFKQKDSLVMLVKIYQDKMDILCNKFAVPNWISFSQGSKRADSINGSVFN